MKKQDQQQPQIGMDVIDNADHFIGTVEEVTQDHIVVQKGFFFPKRHQIPHDAVGSVSENELTLRISREDAAHAIDDSKWADHPEQGEIVPQVGDVEKSAARGGVDPHKM